MNASSLTTGKPRTALKVQLKLTRRLSRMAGITSIECLGLPLSTPGVGCGGDLNPRPLGDETIMWFSGSFQLVPDVSITICNTR